MNTYILKDKTEVEAIPIGKAKITIGDIAPDGRLTICDRAPNLPNSRKARVICKCECGNYTVIDAQSFYNGSTKSCGCYATALHKKLCSELGKKSNPKDYTNLYNPYYEFIERLDIKDNANSFIWRIKCRNCGKEYQAVPVRLISPSRRRGSNPCPCWHNVSKGVLKIEDLLSTNGIEFEREKRFPNCLSPKGNELKFDFFIPHNSLLIEYDGEQHFQPTSFGDLITSAEDKFLQYQEYDGIKDKYCLDHAIPLIRIPYTHFKELTIKDLILTEDNPWLITKQKV